MDRLVKRYKNYIDTIQANKTISSQYTEDAMDNAWIGYMNALETLRSDSKRLDK